MKFIAAILFLVMAFILQFWFASAGVTIDFVFAALMAFAFVFDLWETIFFVVAATFVINWEPSPSFALAAFAALPLLAHGFRKLFPYWQAWAADLIVIAGGLLILYLCVSPQLLFKNIPTFFLDLIVCLVFGEIVLSGLTHSNRQ